MPPKAAVVDAFKSKPPLITMHNPLQPYVDLIRYGKHHGHVNKNDAPSTLPDDSPPPKHKQPAASAPDVSKRAPSPPPPKQEAEPVPAHAEAAQFIVEEERKQKSKMPIYKGLEDYEILDKMGESVPSPFFSRDLALIHAIL